MRKLPFLPLAPLLVVLFGFATAVLVIFYGSRQLRRASDIEATHQAAAIAQAMAVRLRLTPSEDRSPVISQATASGVAELLIVADDGQIIHSGSVEEFSQADRLHMLHSGDGFAQTASGRQRFASRPIGQPFQTLSLIALVEAPEDPPETQDLVRAVAVLTALLLGVAALMSLSYARAANDDIAFVQRRIRSMADSEGDPPARVVPIRSVDEVGVLTVAFNTLVERFVAAEKSYRADLREAAALDEERLQFLAGLSHELRTPLNAVLGFSHILESEVDGPLDADARESVSVIGTSAEHLRTLIDDILDLSALQTGKLKLSKRPVDVRAIADEVVREARSLARDKDLTLEVTGESSLECQADRRRVRQILTNLVANAVKFTPHGQVRVDLAKRGDVAEVKVTDSGPGIAEDEREIIFEAYRQSARKVGEGGTGLGLATVKQLVDLHGGEVHVGAASPSGAVFTFTLPLATDDDFDRAHGARASVPSLPPPAFEGKVS